MGQVQVSLIDQKQSPSLSEILDWGISTTEKVVTIYDKYKKVGKSDEVIVETPRAGSPEGTNFRNVDPKAADRTAEVFNTVEKWIGQVKGLFNLGFPQDSPQPAAPVATQAGSALPFGLSMGALAVIGLAILLLVKK